MVIWSNPAKEDLKRIHDYIAQDSQYYAKLVVAQIISKADSLEEFPKMGREVPEIGDPDIREFPVYSYRLIYRCNNGGIEVLTIVHSKRIFSP